MRDTLLGRRDLRDLRDQWPAVDYIDRKGKHRTHIFDHCARYDSGLVEAIAVKPSDRVDYMPKDGAPSLREIIRLINEQRAILRFAHKAIILTEDEVSDGDAHNAGWLRQARRFRVEQDVREARDALRALGSRFRFHDLVRGAEVSWRRFHAVWSLIDDGVLLAEDQEAIIDRSWLRTAQTAEGV
ncbi:MAG: hypothetical protein ACTHNH_02345 [Mesorhizobium sp.]